MREKKYPHGSCCDTSPPEACAGVRGRPRQIAESERRDKLIEAAEKVFVETGYSTTSVDDIAHRAGMSKKTIYQLYKTKEQLFAAVIAKRRAHLKAMMEAHCCAGIAAPDEVLRRFLGQVARFVLAPRQLALYRLVIAESHRAPELACAFYSEGPTKACVTLAEWLALQHERKVLQVPDPSLSAAMLFSMVISEPQMRILIGLIDGRKDAEELSIDARVAYAVDVFLKGAWPRPQHGTPENPPRSRMPSKKIGRIQELTPVPAK